MVPVRIAGTPVGVQLARLDALRNHVLTPASRAKPGYRSSLILPSAPMIVAAGSSSRMITITGPSSSGTDTSPTASVAPSPTTRADASLKNRNVPTKKRFAADR